MLYRTEKKVAELYDNVETMHNEKKGIESEKKEIKAKRKTMPMYSLWRHSGDIDSKIKGTEEKLAFMKTMYVGFVIKSDIEISDFLKEAKATIKKYDRYKLTYNKNGEIKFGKLKISLSPHST